MMNKEIVKFFGRLSDEDGQHKLTTERIMQIIKESSFSDEVKNDLRGRVESHNNCEFDDLEVNPFVVANYGRVTSLECEGCYSVIIDSDILKEMI